jgi:hypothetical protein
MPTKKARLAVLLGIAAWGPVGNAQVSTRVIDGRPSCAACQITLREYARLVSDKNGPDIDNESMIAMDSSGRFLVTADGGTKVLVFGPDGKRQREFGQVGRGPGEFTHLIDVVFGPGDSVLLVESSRLVHVYSPDYKPLRDVVMPPGYQAMMSLPDGRMVVRANVRTAASAGLPLHIVSPGGIIERSFGSVDPTPRIVAECPQCSEWRLSPAPKQSFWLIRANRYEFTKWVVSGPSSQVRVEKSPWFVAWNSYPPMVAGQNRRPSTVGAVLQDLTGRLWVTGYVAPADWAPVDPPDSTIIRVGRGGTAVASTDRKALRAWVAATRERTTNTIVEVIDEKTDKVIASSRFPGVLTLITPSIALRRVQNADGAVELQLFSVGLSHP